MWWNDPSYCSLVQLKPNFQKSITLFRPTDVICTPWCVCYWKWDVTFNHRTISSTTLRADWSISSRTIDRHRQARACCWGSSWTISSPYRYTPMALKKQMKHISLFLKCHIKMRHHRAFKPRGAYLPGHEPGSVPRLRTPLCACAWPPAHTSDVAPERRRTREITPRLKIIEVAGYFKEFKVLNAYNSELCSLPTVCVHVCEH